MPYDRTTGRWIEPKTNAARQADHRRRQQDAITHIERAWTAYNTLPASMKLPANHPSLSTLSSRYYPRGAHEHALVIAAFLEELGKLQGK